MLLKKGVYYRSINQRGERWKKELHVWDVKEKTPSFARITVRKRAGSRM
jgi:hypothetical protein